MSTSSGSAGPTLAVCGSGSVVGTTLGQRKKPVDTYQRKRKR